MIKNTNAVRVIDLISDRDNRLFLIPRYQRGYTWSKKEWGLLYEDVTNSEKGYYISSILCVTGNTELGTDYPFIEIIDGQQRITTINLMLLAIYSLSSSFEEKYTKKFDKKKFNSLEVTLSERLVSKNNAGNLRSRILLSNQSSNKQDYDLLLFNLGLLKNGVQSPYAGVRLITKAFNYYLGVFKKLIEEDFEGFISFYDKLNEVSLVKIDVEKLSDAFNLFETMNTRGIPLSAMDLIKGRILAELETQEKLQESTIESEVNKWHKIIDNLIDNKTQVRFLRHYYYAFKDDNFILDIQNKLTKKLPASPTRSNIVEIYETISKQKGAAKILLNSLSHAAEIYSQFVNPEGNRLYQELLRIETASAYSFLLLCKVKNIFSDEDFRGLLEIIKVYFLRRNISDYPRTNKLDDIFYGLIALYYSKPKDFNLSLIFGYLFDKDYQRYAKDDLFLERLTGDLYGDYDICRYILTSIEELHRIKTKEREYPDLWKKDKKDNYIFTVEHILPEGTLNEEWIKDIANGDRKKAEELQVQNVHKIGNLTLTAYNSNLSNSPFLIKLEKKDEDNNYIGYKNGLYLNEPVSKKQKWNTIDIEERGKVLIKEIYSIADLEILKKRIFKKK